MGRSCESPGGETPRAQWESVGLGDCCERTTVRAVGEFHMAVTKQQQDV